MDNGGKALNPDLILRVLVLLTVANTAPVIASRICGQSAAWPLDFNQILPDREPIFGPSKTIRGIVLAIAGSACAAPLFGVPWSSGALIATASMAGDLLSSFIKRRLRMRSSSRAPLLDQIPESLFGAVAARPALPLTLTDIFVTTLVFFMGQLIFSRLSYRIGLRKEPY